MDYDNITNSDLKNIVESGIKTEFWAWLKHSISRTKKTAEQHCTRSRINSLDDCISISKFNAIFKTVEEIINLPESVLASIQAQHKQEKSSPDSKGVK